VRVLKVRSPIPLILPLQRRTCALVHRPGTFSLGLALRTFYRIFLICQHDVYAPVMVSSYSKLIKVVAHAVRGRMCDVTISVFLQSNFV